MATIVTRSLRTGESMECSWQEVVLPQIKRCEKKNFTSTEALDFEIELKKRNVTMVITLQYATSPSTAPDLVAYLVLQHAKSTSSVLLHKICVSKSYRRQGIAKSMLQFEIKNLKRRSSRIQLWVHQSNTAATELYKSLGFGKVSELDDYYGPGQKGIRMSLDLWQN